MTYLGWLLPVSIALMLLGVIFYLSGITHALRRRLFRKSEPRINLAPLDHLSWRDCGFLYESLPLVTLQVQV
jgi:hypothetical protein